MAINLYSDDPYSGDQKRTGGPQVNGPRGSGTAASMQNAAIQAGGRSKGPYESFGSLSNQWAQAIPQRNVLGGYMQQGQQPFAGQAPGFGPDPYTEIRRRIPTGSMGTQANPWATTAPGFGPNYYTTMQDDAGPYGGPYGGPPGRGGPRAPQGPQPPAGGWAGGPGWTGEGAPAPPGSTTVIPSTMGRPGDRFAPLPVPPTVTYGDPRAGASFGGGLPGGGTATDPGRYYNLTPFEKFTDAGVPVQSSPVLGPPPADPSMVRRNRPFEMGPVQGGGGGYDGSGINPPYAIPRDPGSPTPSRGAGPSTQPTFDQWGPLPGAGRIDESFLRDTPSRGGGPSTQPTFGGGFSPFPMPGEGAPAPPGSTTIIPSTLGRPGDNRFAPLPGPPTVTYGDPRAGGTLQGLAGGERGAPSFGGEPGAPRGGAPMLPSPGATSPMPSWRRAAPRPKATTTATPTAAPAAPAAATPSLPGFDPTALPNVNQDLAWMDPIKQNAMDEVQRRGLHLGSLSGAVNSGGFIPGLSEKIGEVGSQYDAQKGGMMFQAQQAQADRILDTYKFNSSQDLQRWIKEHEFELQQAGIDAGILTATYAADAQRDAAAYGAQAASAGASASAEASRYNALLDYQAQMAGIGANYGLGQQRLGYDYYNADQNYNLGQGQLGYNFWNSGQNRQYEDMFNRRSYDLGVQGMNRDVYGMDQAQQRYLMDLMWRMSPGGQMSNPGFNLPDQFPY